MKIGSINQQGDITTRQGSDTSNPEAPNGESFNITTGSSASGTGGSLNLIAGVGSTLNGAINIKAASGIAPPLLNLFSGTKKISIQAPASLGQDYNFIFPTAIGTIGQFLKFTGSTGQSSWNTIVISDVSNLQSSLDNKLAVTEATTVATANKILYLDANSKLPASITGSSTSLQTARTISTTGDATWSVSFDGTANVTSAITLANVATAGTYKSVTVNAKGLVTAGTNPTTLAGYGITDAVNSSTYLRGPDASKPTAGTAGRMYFSSDTGAIYYDNGTAWLLESPAYTGDVTKPVNSTVLTLSTTGVTAGTYGSATAIPVITVDAKGRLTTVTTTTVSIPSGVISVTGSDLTMSGTTGTAITNATLSNTGVTAGSGYNTFTVDAKGRISAASTTAYLTSATGVTTFAGGTTGLTPASATSGAITLAGTLAVANGGTGQTTYTNGQILIGNTTGNTLTKATLTAGTNISITNGSGSITINATDQFTGTVTSVAATAPTSGFTITGSPITTSGTLVFALANDLAAVEGLATNGIAVRTATDTWATRSIASANNKITVTNGDGVAGNPTLTIVEANFTGIPESAVTGLVTDLAGKQPLDADLTAIAAFTGTGLARRTGTDTWTLDTNTYLTANQTITISGDATGSGTTAIPLTLATVNSNVGTFAGITVNGKGLVTSATALTTLAGYGITDAVNSSTYLRGLDASKPAFGTAGRIYFSSDTGSIYYDTGTAWLLESPALTGDITKPVNSSVTTLSTTGVTAGSGYNTFTVDAKGRITAASTTAYLTSATGVTTFAGGTTGLTPAAATSGAVTLAGTLAVANGGTGQTTYTNGQILIGNTTGNTLAKSTLTAGANVTITNGAGTITIASADQFVGTVTSVAALTLGTTGTDLNSSVATGTTTPVITLNVPTASATNRGALSSADWTTFNNKQAALVSGTNIKTVGGLTLLGSGDAGTITVPYGGTGLTTIAANNIIVGNGTSALNLVAPTGTNTRFKWTGSAYTWVADTIDNLNNVVISTPLTSQILTYNGTNWVNGTFSVAPTSYSVVVSSWTLVSGNLYSATVTHNLGTKNVNVTLYDTANNAIVFPDSIVLSSTSQLVLTVTGNTHSINVTVLANGLVVAPASNAISVQVNGAALGGSYSAVNFVGTGLSGSSSGGVATVNVPSQPLQRNIFYAASFESPNNSDWVVNALAPVVNDATYPSLIVRQFVDTAETGVGFYATIPSTATSLTFNVKGRALTAPGAAAQLILRLYSRAIPNNAAPGAWSSSATLITIAIPTNAFYQYSTISLSLASLGLTAGNFYEFEVTRNTADSLAVAWNMAELVMEAY